MVIDHINDQICVIIRNVLINKQIVPELWRDTSSSLQVYAGKLLVLREELTEETELQQEEGLITENGLSVRDVARLRKSRLQKQDLISPDPQKIHHIRMRP